MDQQQELVSKVLVLDGSEAAFGVLKFFCHENHLVGLRVCPDHNDHIKDILTSNVDLGAVLISEENISDEFDSLELSRQIHADRPELPIFIRRYDSDDLEGIPEEYKSAFTGAYCLSKLDALKDLVQSHLFDSFYPTEIVNGIKEVSEPCLSAGFRNVNVRAETPFLVRDKIMDEYNSLISLESKWCRGYMMIQVSKGNLQEYIDAGKTGIEVSKNADKNGMELITSLTNDIWGAIKREFMEYGNELDAGAVRAQVPIFINADKRYISFGTEKPQLCYQYQIIDNDKKLQPLMISQKLIFNLDWSPENFEVSEKAVEDFIDSGDLEFF